MKLNFTAAAAALTATTAAHSYETDLQNSTYYNPVLPGWHSDPSCVRVDDTFFCAISTFLAAPGLPVYASKDLIHWKLASHAWSRPDQFGLPNGARDVDNLQGGFFAPTLRHHDGKFYLICTYVSPLRSEYGLPGTVFTTQNPYSNEAWSDALVYNASSIDPDLFWDDDGTVYLHSAGIIQQTIDLDNGDVSPARYIWNGTGGSSPEGPHIYKKNGWYYLLIAEGGTELNHAVTIARARNISGPYQSSPTNPILTNRNTSELFQTVGHADLFDDENGNLWGMALSTRSGLSYSNDNNRTFPMGRESVLYPASWEGDWPILDPVRGVMTGWPLPLYNRDVPGIGPFVDEDDCYDFKPGSNIPPHFLFWRFPQYDDFTISPPGHENALQITPSRMNVTGVIPSNETALTGKLGLSLIMRRQVNTLFTFATDLDFRPQHPGQEAGITVFLTQLNHIDLSIAYADPDSDLASNTSAASSSSSTDHHKHATHNLELRFRVETAGTENSSVPSSLTTTPFPASWSQAGPIRLQVSTPNKFNYTFTAFPASNPNDKIVVGVAPSYVVTLASGQFTGTLVGAYATCNGAGGSNETSCPETGGEGYFSRWTYSGGAQEVDYGQYALDDAV